MNSVDLQNISDLIAGKTAIKSQIETQSLVFLSLGIFLAVLLGVIIANEITK